jgi:hypothetical protein
MTEYGFAAPRQVLPSHYLMDPIPLCSIRLSSVNSDDPLAGLDWVQTNRAVVIALT